MVDITTRNTAATFLSYQEGDEQIAETPETNAGAFNITQTSNRALIEFTGTTAAVATLADAATVLNALDQVDTSNKKIGFRCAVYNNSNVILTLTPTGSDEINGSSTPIPIYPQATVQVWLNEGGDGWVCSEQPVNQNLLINGNFDIWQRGTSVTGQVNNGFLADRWRYNKSGTGVVDIARSTSVPTTSDDTKPAYSHQLTVTTTDASLAAGDAYWIKYQVEGYDYQKIAGGVFTLSFWVKTSVAGTYSIAFRNSAANRAYATQFTTAGTGWEYKTITATADTGGSWALGSSVGLEIIWVLGAGTNWDVSTANTWEATDNVNVSGSDNFMANSSGTFSLAQVKLEAGSVATPFSTAGANIADELAMCKRYYERKTLSDGETAFPMIGRSTSVLTGYWEFDVEKRATPTMGYSTVLANWQVYPNVGESMTSVGSTGPSVHGSGVNFNDTAAPFTQLGGYLLYADTSTTIWMEANAEL